MNQIGAAIDAYLCYFSFRGLAGGVENFRWFLRKFLLLLVPYVVLILYESVFQHNLFQSMGGFFSEEWVRDGRTRCQGSFRNASLLGSIFASFLPLYLGLWFSKIDRKMSVLGIGLCLLIVWSSNSGGPASAVAVAMLGWAFWKLRTKMKFVRRSAVAGFIAMAVIMNAPVWYIIAKVSSVTGGAGWHRAHLLDMAFQHLDRWWLSGMPMTDTADWFPYVLSITGGADITNQFLAFGISAGLLASLLFCAMLIQAYKKIGQSLAIVRSRNDGRDVTEPILWGLGVMLTVHCTNWLGITYFDQSYVIWYFDLAVINNLTESCLAAAKVEEEEVNSLLGSTGQAA
jgi:transcription antitermination factor NusG